MPSLLAEKTLTAHVVLVRTYRFVKTLQLRLTQSHCCCEGVAASLNLDQDEWQHSHAQAGPSNVSDRHPRSQFHHGSASGVEQEAGPLPMLASACPGWVCYAEKTHGSYILPYISTTKSPQVGLAHKHESNLTHSAKSCYILLATYCDTTACLCCKS